MTLSEENSNDKRSTDSETGARAFLENLTGPSKGRIDWLSSDRVRAAVGNDRVLRIKPDEGRAGDTDLTAVLTWQGDSYRIEAAHGRQVWVNGHKIDSVTLMHGDMIEFEELGPMSRFRLCARSFPTHWPIDDILGDALAYTRSSRRPLAGRMSTAVGESLRRIAVQTTIFFRLTVLLALSVIAVFGYVLYQNDKALQQRLEQDARRIEAVTLLLAQTRDEALSPDDLFGLQQQLESRLTRNAERLGALEHRSDAAARVIQTSAPSIAFVQGAFVLRQIESGVLLREVHGPDGNILTTPFGQPRIEPGANGPPAEFQFTGTAFLLENGVNLVTNRHVALPWTSGDKLQAFEASGLSPEMLKLVVYLPGLTGPIDAVLLRASETADLALLSVAPVQIEGRGLALADDPPGAGEEVFLLGYPTGLRALLAQAGRDFIASVEDPTQIDFWTLAALLSERDFIHPLASRGIVAQVNSGAVIYDAETTVGGSGGPALNRNGRVVAINSAILPEFGGSNIGVPVAHLKYLLDAPPSE